MTKESVGRPRKFMLESGGLVKNRSYSQHFKQKNLYSVVKALPRFLCFLDMQKTEYKLSYLFSSCFLSSCVICVQVYHTLNDG